MPDDLHGARRPGVSVLAVGASPSRYARWASSPSGWAARGRAGPLDAGPADAMAEPQSAATPRSCWASRATDSRRPSRLEARCDDRRAYLDLRRNAAASLERVALLDCRWPRKPRSGRRSRCQEAGGALGALDRATAAQRLRGGPRRRQQRRGAVSSVRDLAMARSGHSACGRRPGAVGRAYRLGQATLESTAYVPEGDDAALADALGFLDFSTKGALPSASTSGADVAPRPATVASRGDLVGGARIAPTIVRATGILGTAIRPARRPCVWAFRRPWPYRPLRDGSDMSALTLPRPAPRRPTPRGLRSAGRSSSIAGCRAEARALRDLPRARPCLRGRPRRAALARSHAAASPQYPLAPLRTLAALLTWDGRVRTADRQALRSFTPAPRWDWATTELAKRRGIRSPRTSTDFREAFKDGVTPRRHRARARGVRGERARAGHARSTGSPGRRRGALADARAGFDVFAGQGPLRPVPCAPGLRRKPATGFHRSRLRRPRRARGTVAPARPRSTRTPVAEGATSGCPPSATSAGQRRTSTTGATRRLEQVIDFYDRGGGQGSRARRARTRTRRSARCISRPRTGASCWSSSRDALDDAR